MSSRSSRTRKQLQTAAMAALFVSSAAYGQTWTGPAAGSWNVAGNWSPGTIPNSASAIVLVDNGAVQNSTVTVDGSVTVNTLTISSVDLVSVANNVTLFWGGTGALNLSSGNLSINAAANNSVFSVGGTTTISGAGSINMTETEAGGTALITGGGTLNNSSLIQGAGNIGGNSLFVSNTGTILASAAAGLTIDPANLGATAGFTSSGTLLANGGVLTLTGSNSGFFTNSGRIIAGSTDVNLVSNVDIRGGTFSSSGSGVIRVLAGNTGNLTSATNDGNITLDNSTQLNLGSSFANNGSVNLNAGANSSVLNIAGSMSITGAGVINLSQSGAGAALITGSGTLTTSNTIQGTGNVGGNSVAIVNNGTIIANTGGMTIDPPNLGGAPGFTNNGTLLANTGALTLTGSNAGFFDNTNGRITAGASDVNLVSNVDIRGGTLSSSGSGVIRVQSGNTANLTSATKVGNLVLDNNTQLNLGGNFTNTGSMSLNAAANSSVLSMGGITNLNGGGTTTMNQTGAGGVALITGGGTMNTDNFIQGAGNIGGNSLTVTSNNTILANNATQSLVVDPPNNGSATGFTNNGTMLANGGVLVLTGSNSGFFTNNGRVIAGSTDVQLQAGADIRGGTFSSSGTGIVRVPSLHTAGLTAVTNNGNLAADNNSTIFLGTSLANTGSVNISAGTNNSALTINTSTVSLSGGGVVTLTATGAGGTAFINGDGTLTSNNTIQGTGNVGANNLTIFSSGLVQALTGGMTIDPPNDGVLPGFTNSGTLLANTGPLILTGSNNGFFNNTAGRINASGSDVQLVTSVEIRGGTFSSGTGVIRALAGNNAFLTNITNNGNITHDGGSANLFVAGAITNNGSFNINSGTSTFSRLNPNGGSVTFSGSGTINLNESGGGAFISGSGTFTSNQNIRGAGNIGGNDTTFFNNSTITATNGSFALTIDPVNNGGTPGFFNNGTLASAGGVLILTGSNAGFFDNTNGRIIAGASDVQMVTGNSIVGGILSSSGSGVIRALAGNNAFLTNITNNGNITHDGGSANLFVAGAITNNGSFNINSGTSTFSRLNPNGGSVTFSGSGTVNLNESGGGAFISGSGTFTSNQNMRGAGNIGGNDTTFFNNSTITATNGSFALTIDPINNGGTPGFFNNGTIQASGGVVVLTGSNAGFFDNTNGRIIAGSTDVQMVTNNSIVGGILSSSGTGIVRVPAGNNAFLTNITNNGNVTHDGGSANLFVGGAITNNGSFNINSGTSTFSQLNPNGGSVTFSGPGVVRMNESGGGAFLAGSGTFVSNQTVIGAGNIGGNTTTFVNNGTVTANNASFALTIDPPNNGGTPGFFHNGVLRAAGGEMIMTGSNAGFMSGNGSLDIASNGTFTATTSASVTIGTVALNGVLNVTNSSAMNVTSFRGAGAASINSSATLTVAANGTDTGASKLATINTATSGRLDLVDNDLVVTTTPKASVQALIVQGRAGGAWTGAGITSSAARNQVDHVTGLGLMSGAEYFSIYGNGAPFDSMAVSSTDALVKYTWNGDADFSGVVDFDDYIKIDNGFNGGLTGWINGDFNLDGQVDFDDYVLIDAAFNKQTGTLLGSMNWISGDDRSVQNSRLVGVQRVIQHLQEFGQVYADHFLASVPEPATISAIALAMPLLVRRRRIR